MPNSEPGCSHLERFSTASPHTKGEAHRWLGTFRWK
uniref:Uncharacterized protein n=1 Tax=Cercocebus atys TaxID=9531 RepID=A0A2K5LPE5_CERAT